MFGTKKNIETIDVEQHEFFENAQRRIKQKKRLFQHFVIFLLVSVFVFALGKLMGYGLSDWWIVGVLAWSLLLVYHCINVFIISPFLGKDWERKQREKLISIQKQKIQKIQDEIEKSYSENYR